MRLRTERGCWARTSKAPTSARPASARRTERTCAVPTRSSCAAERAPCALSRSLPKKIRTLREEGIVASLGHSQASYEQAMKAFRNGAKSVTHLFNGMPPFHHRTPGLAGAALDADVFCELIADGVHSHTAVFRLLLKMKGVERIVLVSDAMRGACLGEGEWDLGGQTVTVHGPEAKLADGTLAGSVLTLDLALRNFAAATGLPLWEATRLVSENPARLLGERDRGRIEPGYRADFVLLDEGWRVLKTFVEGKEVFDRHENRDCKGL